METPVLAIGSRRYDIDWLRIGAVLLLIPFHTARVFNVGEDFYAKNAQLSAALQRFILFVGPWHMSLLFVLAGAATWFALGFRSGRRYAGERLKRLLVPFLFGLVVIIPPQAYVGMLTNTTAARSWWNQYAYFWTHWEDPASYAGPWTPGHLWFILFLLVFALLAVGLFVWMRRGGGHRLVDWFAAACRIPGMVIVLPAVLLLAQQALVPMDDISGQTPVGFLLLFVIGFLMVADERVTAAIDRQWWWALALGVVAMATRAALWPAIDGYPDPSWQDSVVNWVAYQVGLWMVIVGLLGLFHRYAARRGGAYGYAAEAAYPFYILHQTVIVALAWFVVQWDASVPLKFAVIAVAALFFTVAIYEVAVRRWGPVRFLFGMKPRRTREGEPAPRE